jgi:cytochrome P450
MMIDLNEEEVTEELCKYNAKVKKTLTNNELLSQSLLFSMVGTETTSTTLTNISYNLAMNQQVQNKLIAEIDATLTSNVFDLIIFFLSMIFC